MEALEQYFENVRRSAVIVKKQQPFIDWLLHYDKETIIDEMVLEGDVYLLPDFETTDEMEKWMKKNFDSLFSDQLNGWYTDKAMWPQNRTLEMFKEWFSYNFYTMIWDTQEGFIEKE
jgi:hypothetical protein